MAETFGPARYERSVWALCPGAPEVDLCLIGFWKILLGQQPILLLGPLAVRPEMRGYGFGPTLVRSGLARAKASGWPLVLVSGEPDYYPKFGFVPAAAYRLTGQGLLNRNCFNFVNCPLERLTACHLRDWRFGPLHRLTNIVMKVGSTHSP